MVLLTITDFWVNHVTNVRYELHVLEFGARYSVNVNIEGNCDTSSISQGFANFFASNFYNSESNLLLKNCFLEKYELYASNANNRKCLLFSFDDVNNAIAKLKKIKHLILMVSTLK